MEIIHTIYRMVPLFQWPWVTSDLIFKITTIFDIEYLRNDRRISYRPSYCRTSTGSHICALSNGDIFNDIDGRPLTRFSRSQYFWSRIYQKRCILGTKLLKNTNSKPYTIYRMITLSMTLSDVPHFKVTTFFDFEYLVRNDTRLSHIVTIERQ